MERGKKLVMPLLFLPLCLQGKEDIKNVLFIAIDDLRPTIGCYGDSYAITPHLDAFAAKGLLFRNAYCQQSVSGPSRASMLTGLRPDEIGVTDLSTHFREKDPHITTLPQLFKKNGYEAIGIGKIYHGSLQTQDSISWSRPPVYNLSIKKEEYTLPDNRHGKKATAVEIADAPETSFMDGKVTREALTVLDELSVSGQAFFLAVGYIKPHLPFSMPLKYWNLYKDRPIVQNKSGYDRPLHTPTIAYHNWEELRGYTDIPESGDLSPEKQEELSKAYYACVSFIDAQIGQLLDKLRTLGLDKNTVVVIWGDNGFHLGEQSLWGKSTNFEFDCKVPLLIYSPQYQNCPREINKIVELIDIYPTLIDLCGLKPQHTLSGQSLRYLAEGKANWKNRAFSQFPRPYKAINSHKYQTHMGYTVRTTNWRYILWYEKASDRITDRELYRMNGDKPEKENISGKPEYAHIENELQELIQEYKNSHHK